MNQEFFSSIPIRLSDLFSELSSERPWEILPGIEDYIRSVIKLGNHGTAHGDAHIEGDVEIGEGTVIEHGAVIKGPTIIGKNCEIRSGAYIRGCVITGDSCVIGHTTEIIRSVLFDHVRLDHFNYVGDSILGNGVHFGAGAKIANLRFDEAPIVIDGVDTGLKKFGVVFGDHCQLGTNASVGPGVLFTKGAWLTLPHQLDAGTYDRNVLRHRLHYES